MMSFIGYLNLIGFKINEAFEKGDKDEVLRLLRLLNEVIIEKIEELDK